MWTCQYEIVALIHKMSIKKTLQLARFITHLALETAGRTLDILNSKMVAFLPLYIMALFVMGRCVSGIEMPMIWLR